MTGGIGTDERRDDYHVRDFLLTETTTNDVTKPYDSHMGLHLVHQCPDRNNEEIKGKKRYSPFELHIILLVCNTSVWTDSILKSRTILYPIRVGPTRHFTTVDRFNNFYFILFQVLIRQSVNVKNYMRVRAE